MFHLILETEALVGTFSLSHVASKLPHWTKKLNWTCEEVIQAVSTWGYFGPFNYSDALEPFPCDRPTWFGSMYSSVIGDAGQWFCVGRTTGYVPKRCLFSSSGKLFFLGQSITKQIYSWKQSPTPICVGRNTCLKITPKDIHYHHLVNYCIGQSIPKQIYFWKQITDASESVQSMYRVSQPRTTLVQLLGWNYPTNMLSSIYICKCTHCVSAAGWSELDSLSPVSRSVHVSVDTAPAWRITSSEALPGSTASFWTVCCASCSCVGALGAHQFMSLIRTV